MVFPYGLIWCLVTSDISIVCFCLIVLVVSVDSSAEFGCHGQTAPHELVSGVVGHIKLEEASMGLGECTAVHARNEPHLVLVCEIVKAHGESTATPDKLQVSTSLYIAERLENSPESIHNLVSFFTIGVWSDALETLLRNMFVTSATRFHSLPVWQFKNRCLAFDDNQESLSNCFDLLSGLIFASFEHFGNEVVNVVLCHLNWLSTCTQRNLFSRWENSCECLVNSSREVRITESLGILLQIAQHLGRVRVNGLKVFKSDIFFQELLPEPWGEVEGHRRFTAEGESQECSQVLEHMFVSWRLWSWVQDEAITVRTMLVSVVRCANEQRHCTTFKLSCDVDKRVAERSTSILRALTLKVDRVALGISC